MILSYVRKSKKWKSSPLKEVVGPQVYYFFNTKLISRLCSVEVYSL